MGALMIENAFCDELIDRLAERYEEDPSEFVHLPQPTVASSLARLTVSEAGGASGSDPAAAYVA